MSKSCVESIPQTMNPMPFVHHQAGAIPFRVHPVNGLEYLLVTNRSKTKWVFPKGHVELGTTAAHQATVEAYEEAGVLGKLLLPSAGSFEYRKAGSIFRVTVFMLHVEREVNHWPEVAARQRSWKTFAEALRMQGRAEAQHVFSNALRSVEERFMDLEATDANSDALAQRWRAAI